MRFKFKPIKYREPVSDILKRLKSQESTPVAKPEVWINKTETKKPEPITTKKDITLQKVEKLLRKIEDLERKAKQVDSYLTYYVEIKQAEQEFLNAVRELEHFINLDHTSYQRLKLKKEAIERKHSSSKR